MTDSLRNPRAFHEVIQTCRNKAKLDLLHQKVTDSSKELDDRIKQVDSRAASAQGWLLSTLGFITFAITLIGNQISVMNEKSWMAIFPVVLCLVLSVSLVFAFQAFLELYYAYKVRKDSWVSLSQEQLLENFGDTDSHSVEPYLVSLITTMWINYDKNSTLHDRKVEHLSRSQEKLKCFFSLILVIIFIGVLWAGVRVLF